MSTIHGVTHTHTITSYGAGAPDAAPSGGGASPLLPEPNDPGPLGGDVFTELATLLEKAGQNDRRMIRREEAQSEIIQAREEAAKVAAMHAKADAEGAQGFTEGIAQIGEGALELGAGGCEMRAGASDADKWRGASKLFMGGAKGAQAYGSIAGKGYKAEADHRDADASEHGANAGAAERAAKHAHDAVQEVNESLQKVAKFLEEVEAGTNGARSAAVIRG